MPKNRWWCTTAFFALGLTCVVLIVNVSVPSGLFVDTASENATRDMRQQLAELQAMLANHMQAVHALEAHWQRPAYPRPPWGLVEACSVKTCFSEKTGPRCAICRQWPRPAGWVPAPVPPGFVPDARLLRRWAERGHDDQGEPFPPSPPSEYCGDVGDSNVKKALRSWHLKADGPGPRKGDVSLFCCIYTTSGRHHSLVRAQRETWGSACDGFVVFSNETDPSVPSVALDQSGPEHYNNMWQKLRSIWRYVDMHYIDDFQYFISGGDDFFLLPQNLRNYIAAHAAGPDRHFYHGRRFQVPNATLFNSGGAGYVLSRATLRLLVKHLDDPPCDPEIHMADEDVRVAKCLKHTANITAADTRDSQGRERFHPFHPALMYTWRYDPNDWFTKFNKPWGVKEGADCCAADSVSFHFVVTPASLRQLYALLYHCGDLAR